MNLHVSKRFAIVAPSLYRLKQARKLAFVFFAVSISALQAEDATSNSPILANLSFAQLSQIQIVSASQRSESAADVLSYVEPAVIGPATQVERGVYAKVAWKF